MDIPDDETSFAELQEFVYRRYHKDIRDLNFPVEMDSFYEAIEDNPIGRRRINQLKTEGWRINLVDRFSNPSSKVLSSHEISELLSGLIGLANFSTKNIEILKNGLESYQRDKTICHELVHAVYGNISNDFYLAGETRIKNDDLIKKRNNALTEWYARQIRATPTLLSAIWNAFDIPSKIYDRASLMASDYLVSGKKQRIFPSFYKDYDFTLMD